MVGSGCSVADFAVTVEKWKTSQDTVSTPFSRSRGISTLSVQRRRVCAFRVLVYALARVSPRPWAVCPIRSPGALIAPTIFPP